MLHTSVFVVSSASPAREAKNHQVCKRTAESGTERPAQQQVFVHQPEEAAVGRHHGGADEEEADEDEERPDRGLERKEKVFHRFFTGTEH